MATDYRRLLAEGPTVVGMITSVLGSGGSVDSAVRYVAERGPELSGGMFSSAVRLTDTRGARSIEEALRRQLDGIPRKASGYRDAVSMCLVASEFSDRDHMQRMLDDASNEALESVRQMGESYGESLNLPCMAIFAAGIMVPMILMSLMPIMDLGGMFSSGILDRTMLVLITLVIVPCGMLLMSLGIRSGNPFGSRLRDRRELKTAMPLLIAIPLALLLDGVVDDDMLLLCSVSPACLAVLAMVWREYREAKGREACEEGLRDSVFDLGNRMVSGENFESASVSAIGSNPGCSAVAERLRREFEVCRGNCGDALRRSVSGISDEVSASLSEILRCSSVDLSDAGELAITLGRQYQDRRAAMASLSIKLKSMTDMMMGTAMVFAPLILGLSTSMMAPLADITGYQSLEGSGLILGAYLVEMCALVSLLLSSLGKDEPFVSGLWRFCLMCPIALAVFAVSCSVRIRRGQSGS